MFSRHRTYQYSFDGAARYATMCPVCAIVTRSPRLTEKKSNALMSALVLMQNQYSLIVADTIHKHLPLVFCLL